MEILDGVCKAAYVVRANTYCLRNTFKERSSSESRALEPLSTRSAMLPSHDTPMPKHASLQMPATLGGLIGVNAYLLSLSRASTISFSVSNQPSAFENP